MGLELEQKRFAFPGGFDAWWTTDVAIPESAIDSLGHVTAAYYPKIIEKGSFAYLGETFEIDDFMFVTAELHVHYRRELLAEHSPVRVHARIAGSTDSSIDFQLVIADSLAEPKAFAECLYVAWDREDRRRRPFDERELRIVREALGT